MKPEDGNNIIKVKKKDHTCYTTRGCQTFIRRGVLSIENNNCLKEQYDWKSDEYLMCKPYRNKRYNTELFEPSVNE